MSRQRIIKALTSLGLSQIDANVYIYLASMGPQRIENIGDALKLGRWLLHQSLVNLQMKGLVNSAASPSVLFFALPFEEALELLVKAQLRKAQTTEEHIDEILSKWRRIVTEHSNC